MANMITRFGKVCYYISSAVAALLMLVAVINLNSDKGIGLSVFFIMIAAGCWCAGWIVRYLLVEDI